MRNQEKKQYEITNAYFHSVSFFHGIRYSSFYWEILDYKWEQNELYDCEWVAKHPRNIFFIKIS